MVIEEAIVSCLLEAAIEGVGESVYCETQIMPPDEYILVERTAGSETDHLRTAMVAVQSISTESLYRAAKINEAAIDALLTFGEESTEVFSCRLNSNYNYTNPTTKEYRYQAVFDIRY